MCDLNSLSINNSGNEQSTHIESGTVLSLGRTKGREPGFSEQKRPEESRTNETEESRGKESETIKDEVYIHLLIESLKESNSSYGVGMKTLSSSESYWRTQTEFVVMVEDLLDACGAVGIVNLESSKCGLSLNLL